MSEEFENTSVTGIDRIEFLQRKAARLESEASRWRREETALRDMERRYLALLENPLFIFMIISGGRVSFLNATGEEFFGFSLRERPKFLLADLVAPGFCAQVEALLKKDGENGPWAKRSAFPVILGDGGEKWLDMTVTPADPVEDDILLALAREIPPPGGDCGPEEPGAFEISPGSENIKGAVIGPDWTISSMTAGFVKDGRVLWDKTPSEGMSVLELEAPGDGGLPFRLAAERAFNGEWAEIGREASGKFFTLSFAPLFSPQGMITGISLALCDKTGEKSAERAARAGEEKFRRLFSLVSDPCVILTGDEGRILDCNRAFRERTGIGEGRAEGRTLEELGLISPEDLKMIQGLTAGGKAGPAELARTLPLPSGEALTVVITAAPLTGEGPGAILVAMKETLLAPSPPPAGCPERPVGAQIRGREEFLKTLSEEAEAAERTRKPLSLILVEIDDFQGLECALNDGERARFIDDFYRSVSDKIQPGDYIAGLGAGEFAILTAAGGYIAHRSAEKVRSMAFHSKILPGVKISCSLGVSEFRREMTPGEFMKRASIALREAKRAGGNRAVLAPAVS